MRTLIYELRLTIDDLGRAAQFVVVCMACCVTLSTAAAEVRFNISATETYIGKPIALTIELENVTAYDPPAFPKIDGVLISEPSQSRSSMTQIINGRMTQSDTIILTFRLVPQQTGTFPVPAIKVTADGQNFVSQAYEVTVVKSETGDLMFAEVVAEQESIYLGQPLRLTLHIWVKQYQDRQLGMRLNAQVMWERIDGNGSTWADFAGVLGPRAGMATPAEVSAAEVQRTDAAGNSVPYFLYEISTTMWPRQAGQLTLQSPIIVMDYPIRLSRDTFGPRLAETRPIAVTATPPQVIVKEPPTANQPASFNGAVGQFDISVEARPVDAAVGDPITLTITLIDRTDATAVPERLELLQPPRLDRVDELNQNFRMPGDALAGTVRNSTKVFTQTIRAKSSDVTRIPPIPFSYFDPATAKYVTRSSNAIPITVKEATQVSLTDIVQAPTAPTTSAPTELREIAGGLVANYSDVDVLLASHQFRLTWIHLAALAAPPLLFAGVSLARLTTMVRERDGAGRRRRGAKRRALSRLHEARRLAAAHQAQAVISALSDYVADRLDLPHGTLTCADITSTLRRNGASGEDITTVQNLLGECEQSMYAGGSEDRPSSDWTDRAATCIKRLERSGV